MDTPANRFSAIPAVVAGDTADVYFLRTRRILEVMDVNPVVAMEVFPSRAGIICGVRELVTLLDAVLPAEREVMGLQEGDVMEAKEVVLRITCPYQSLAIYETAILGTLAHPSGWATAAREAVTAARGVPVISFGARHVHPLVAGRMDYAAIVGGCSGCSSIEGARLAGIQPTGTMPHALMLVLGDTVSGALAFDRIMPPEVARIVLVDTFKDEAEESLRVAEAMGDRLQGVRLDTPSERGRVTPDLVKEVRARLDLAGYKDVKIVVSGGVNPTRITQFLDSGAQVDIFAVGSYITASPPIDFTADIRQVDGKPIAKRGRIPGITPNPRLQRLL